jgi:beta-glucosidase-like glycosyl hydrolase
MSGGDVRPHMRVTPPLPQRRRLNQLAAQSSLVLLQNAFGILPLQAGAHRIAVLGPHATATNSLIQVMDSREHASRRNGIRLRQGKGRGRGCGRGTKSIYGTTALIPFTTTAAAVATATTTTTTTTTNTTAPPPPPPPPPTVPSPSGTGQYGQGVPLCQRGCGHVQLRGDAFRSDSAP